MEISLFEKMKIIFDLLFSSFMFIEIFLFFLLLLALVLVNLKVKNKIVPIVLSIFLGGAIIFFVVSSYSYVLLCIDSFIMKVMDYYYFPSTVVYFFLLLFAIIIFIYSMFSKKLSVLKKGFNYFCTIFIFLFFTLFLSLATMNHIDLADPISLYQNSQILAIVQFSNLLFLVWIIITCFYHLSLFFKKKVDKEELEN